MHRERCCSLLCTLLSRSSVSEHCLHQQQDTHTRSAVRSAPLSKPRGFLAAPRCTMRAFLCLAMVAGAPAACGRSKTASRPASPVSLPLLLQASWPCAALALARTCGESTP